MMFEEEILPDLLEGILLTLVQEAHIMLILKANKDNMRKSFFRSIILISVDVKNENKS